MGWATSFLGLLTSKVTGASSSTNNSIVRFDGTTGKLIKNSLAILNDLGEVTFKTIRISSLGGVNCILIDEDGSFNEKKVFIQQAGEAFRIFLVADNELSSLEFMTVERTELVCDEVKFRADIFTLLSSDGTTQHVSIDSEGGKFSGGFIELAEITTPSATADKMKIYSKSDDKLYFQDGAGVEHQIALV